MWCSPPTWWCASPPERDAGGPSRRRGIAPPSRGCFGARPGVRTRLRVRMPGARRRVPTGRTGCPRGQRGATWWYVVTVRWAGVSGPGGSRAATGRRSSARRRADGSVPSVMNTPRSASPDTGCAEPYGALGRGRGRRAGDGPPAEPWHVSGPPRRSGRAPFRGHSGSRAPRRGRPGIRVPCRGSAPRGAPPRPCNCRMAVSPPCFWPRAPTGPRWPVAATRR